MKRNLLVTTICVLCVLATTSVGCGVSSVVPEEEEVGVVRLDQATIDEAVTQCQDKTTWGINLAKMRTQYKPGWTVESVIVLHNGNDADRVVEISYKPSYGGGMDADTGVVYDPAPIEASEWVTIDTNSIRMKPMETRVIPIYLLVPADYVGLPDNWEFGVRALGTKVLQFQQTVSVSSEATSPEQGERPDTTVQISLAHPLLENKLVSVLDIVSSIDEAPYATSYDPATRKITVERLVNLTDDMVANIAETPYADAYDPETGLLTRNITIIYEYGEPFVIAYTQRWLITMV